MTALAPLPAADPHARLLHAYLDGLRHRNTADTYRRDTRCPKEPEMIRTHTKTYALMNAWAQSFPWDCLIRETTCVSATHDHDVMVDQPCAVPECREPIRDRESCYRVTEVEGYVCWRHVHPDEGPKPYPAS